MKYIGNAFSVNMIKGDALLSISTISKDEYVSNLEDGYSIIGHPEIASHFGVALNRESITLEGGDILYVVTTARRPNEGKTVENGETYNFVTEDEGWAYRKITIFESG